MPSIAALKLPYPTLTTAVALAIVASAAGVHARQSPAEEFFGETVEVRVVNVDVHVVDPRGRPVEGLTREDFELLVDGSPVPIAYFQAIGGAARERAAAGKGPGTGDEPAVADPGALPGRRIVIFVDQRSLKPAGRKRALNDLSSFTRRKLSDGDLVMVASYDRGLQVPLPFTRDREAVEPVLAELLRAPALGVLQDRERRRALEQIEAAPSCEEGINAARTFAVAVYAEQDGSLAALDRVIASLAGLPGPKALFYVSDGLELRAAEDLCQLLATRCPAEAARILSIPGEYSHVGALRTLAGRANARRVSFYPLEALGLTVPSASDIEQGPRRSARDDGSDFTSPVPTWVDAEPVFDPAGHGNVTTVIDQVRAANRQGSLTFLAAETGGLAVLNANSFGRDLARIERRLGSYYSLGFEPASLEPGRTRRLEVRVQRPKVEVDHPASYVEIPREERLADRLHALLLHGGAEDNAMAARFELLDRRPAAGRGQIATFRLFLPRLEPAPAPPTAGARLLVLLATRSDSGQVSPASRVELPVPAGAESLTRNLELTLETGPQRVGAVVMDRATGLVSWLSHRLDAEPAAPE